MKYGDIVRNKTTGKYGTVHYSMFGCSIHTYNEEENILAKTLGDRWENVEKDWEVCDMPEGYEWDKSGLYIRRIK